MGRKKMHPEDARSEVESHVTGQQRARAFCLAHAEALVVLIATYGDGDAHDVLDALRESFWSEPEKWAAKEDAELRAALAEHEGGCCDEK